MLKIKANIPNIITACNLVCGILGILAILSNEYFKVIVLLGICFLSDFADGLVARVLGVPSEFGKQMDSLADVVSFGVLPSFMAVHMLAEAFTGRPFSFDSIPSMAYLGLILAVFAAFRLAKFNIDTRQTEAFIGLNTPAMTIFVLGLWAHRHLGSTISGLESFYHSFWGLAILFLVLGILMVSEIPFFSLKFKKLTWATHKYAFILIGLSVLSLLLFQYLGLSMAIILYFGLSILKVSNSNERNK